MLLTIPLWLLVSTISIIFIMLTKFFKTYLKSAWLVFRLPGPAALPLIGHAHWAINSERLIYAGIECPKKYGLLIGVWLSVFPIAAVLDPFHIQKILTNSKHLEKLGFYKIAQEQLGPGLISLYGAAWKVHRRLMQPMFNQSQLKPIVDVFSKAGDVLTRKLQNQLNKSITGSMDVKISPIVNDVIFSLVTESVLGVKMESTAALRMENESPYRSCTFSLFHRLLRPWLLFPALFQLTSMAKTADHQKDTLAAYTRKVMEERKKLSREGKAIDHSCIMDQLLQISAENPENFTEDDCVDEATTLMLVGQDSVATTLAFILHCMANNPIEQEKAFNEQKAIFGDSKDPATIDDLSKMTYLKMCINETMRLYPTVPLIGRTLGEDLQLGKWLLPKGCEVIISPFATHRLEEYYPQPEVFRPERFEAQAAAERPPFSYIPFSAGPRNCIGYKYAELEMKAIMSAVLRNFKLSRVEGRFPGRKSLSIRYRLTLRAEGGIWVSLSPRNNVQPLQDLNSLQNNRL